MNKKQKRNFKEEQGITLIALIITIIILVILAAVSVRAVYNMGIVDYAINGTQNYAGAAVKENQMLGETGLLIENTITKLNEIETGHPSINKYGFYFDSPYSVTMPGNVRMSVVFKENGAMEAYANKIPYRFSASNTCDYTTPNSIKIFNVPCQISDEGLSVTFPGALVDAMLEISGSTDTKLECTFEEYRNVYFNRNYIIVPSDDENEADLMGVILGDIEFYENNTAKYTGKNKATSHVSDYTSHKVVTSNGSTFASSMDGRNCYIMNAEGKKAYSTYFSMDATFPVTYGDITLTKDYCYQVENLVESEETCSCLYVRDKSKTTYGDILNNINGTPVTSMDNVFSNCTSIIKAPTIPSTVTSLSNTFSNCTSLTTAPTIPSGVIDIMNAFYGCTNASLTSITYAGTKTQWEAIEKTNWNTGSNISTVYCQGSDETIDVSSTQ